MTQLNCRRWAQRACRVAAGAAVALAASGAARAQAESPCGSLQNAFGPLDYRTQRGDALFMVESHHFTREVETLVRGHDSYLGGDLDYTLRAFPNHHRALLAVIRYGEKIKKAQAPDMPRTVECYLERAIRWKPDDTTARLIYATYLVKNARIHDAGEQLEFAARSSADNPFTQYNVGLIYLDAHDYERALRQAHIAYALGFPRPDLKDKLVAAGKWRDAPAGSAAAPESAASTPTAASSAAGG